MHKLVVRSFNSATTSMDQSPKGVMNVAPTENSVKQRRRGDIHDAQLTLPWAILPQIALITTCDDRATPNALQPPLVIP